MALFDFPMRRRVRAGMAVLDKSVPDWHWRINIDTLDLAHNCRCVCGQLYGRFSTGVMALLPLLPDFAIWHPNDTAAAHGFLARAGWLGSDAYPKLTRIWREEILAKREHDAKEEKHDLDDYLRRPEPTADVAAEAQECWRTAQ